MIDKQKKLRESIKNEIRNILNEKKSETLSGMTKVKDTHNQTIKDSDIKPVKVIKSDTKSGPASNTATSDVKPDKLGIEIKKMKNKDLETPKKTNDSFEMNIDGISYKVKGASNAESSYTLLIGHIRKALEGKGTFVKKITIDMGDKPSKLEESVRKIVRAELKKVIFN